MQTTSLRILAAAALAALCQFTAPATAAPTEYPVGEVISLTGVNARGGTGMHEGMKVAEAVFNQRGGPVRVKLVTIDDESSPAKAMAAVEKLASDKVVAITGGATSDIVAPAATAADKLGMVFMTSGGTSAEFVSQGYQRFFRINNTTGYVKAMAGLIGEMKAKKVAVAYSTKKSTSELATGMQDALKAQGIQVTMYPFDAATSDYKPLVNRIKLQARPDIINVLGYENDYIGLLRAARVLKPDIKAVVGAWQIATLKMYKDFPDLVDKTYGTEMLPVPAKFDTPDGKAFEAAYQRMYHHEPDYLAEYGYVQATLLFDAIGKAAADHTLAHDGIAQHLRNTQQDTIIGHVRFDAHGDNVDFMQNMGQHQGDKIVIVWPPQRATGKMQFPGSPWQ